MGQPPIILDFATSLVAEGKALVALRGGKPLPDGAVVDGDGNLTNDPRPLYGDTPAGAYPDPHKGPGALTGFGLHKGSGLNFFMEMMAGALAGSGTSAGADDKGPRRFCNGMLSIFLAVDAFHADTWFSHEIESYVRFYTSARPTDPGARVLIPGDMERLTMDKRRETGLPLPRPSWQDIIGAARRVGLGDDALESLLGAGFMG
jgi:uncharacterized oxidoreductase